MLRDMGEDEPLARLARRGAARQTRQVARATHEAARDRARAQAARRALAIESLDRWARLRRLFIAVLCIGAVVAVGAVVATRGKPSALEYFAIVGGTLLALFVGLLASEKAAGVFAAWELHKLARLPFRFDTEGYRNALGSKRDVCSPTLMVAFAVPVAIADRALITNAIAGAAAGARATWSADELCIESSPLDTVFRPVRTRGGGAKSFYSNHRVHTWVHAVVAGALVPIHGRAPIESVAVSLHR